MPPIDEWVIAFAGIVPRRFQAIGDTTEHDGYGYHGLSRAWSRTFTQFVQEVIRLPNSAANSGTSRPQAFASLRRDSHGHRRTGSL
jgi:hypothetical protein